MRGYQRVTAARGVARAVVVILATLVLGQIVLGQAKQIAASEAWVKLPASGETQAKAFANIENPTMYDIYITSATADVAGKVELRDAGQSGEARLKPLEFITVPAYGSASMGPNGAHLALLDLKRPLNAGDTVTFILKTDGGATLPVTATVKKE